MEVLIEVLIEGQVVLSCECKVHEYSYELESSDGLQVESRS